MHNHHHEESDVEEARQRAKQSRKQIDTGGRFRPPEGQSTIRVLETPADKERNSPALFWEYQVHRNFGPHKRFARCGNEPGETGKCWLCRKAAKLIKEGRTKEAAKLAPQLTLAVQVAVLDKDLDEWIGPLIWEMGSGKSADAMGYKIRGVVCSDRRNYTDHKKGYDLDFSRKGTQLKTKWSDIDHADKPSKVDSGIVKKLKPFVDTDIAAYNEQWQKDAYYGRDTQKGEEMAKKKKDEDEVSDASASDSSSSDSSSSDASSSDSSDASSSDASSSDSSSSDSSDSSDASEKKSKPKKGKKGKKESSDSSDSSSSDSSSSDSDASSSDSSSSDSDASSSDSSSSDASSSDASSSDSSSSDSSDDGKKPAKRKPRSDKGKPRKAAKAKKVRRKK